jgi:arylsulfatase A-like enzyme
MQNFPEGSIMYSQRECLRLASFAFILLLTAIPVGLAADIRPNIVVMLVDDMGIMDTSLPFLTDEAGQPKRYPLNEFYRTPNMERLASRGVRFNNFYAMSVCSPTRISIMTGQNAARHRTTNWINPDQNNAGPNGPRAWNWRGLKKSDTTLAKLLQQSGYRTIHVGKGHFGPRESEGADPLNLGFDINVGGCSIGQPGSYYAKQNFGLNGKRDARAVPHLEKYHGSELFLTEALTLEAKAHVSAAVEEGKPFFLYFPQYAVHAPFNADPRFEPHYQDSGKSPQAQAFATLVEGMDKSLGDVLDHLETVGAAENTLVIFLGDNGSDAPLGHQHAVACAAPLRGKKGAHYEGGMRVPFIAAWAKPVTNNSLQLRLPIQSGAIQSQVASVCDLFPTLLSLADVVSPANHIIDGWPLDRLMTGQPDPQRDQIFLMHYPHSPHRSDNFTVYREGEWKVIYHYLPTEVSGGSHYQLFNLRGDPFEQTDMAAREPEELRRMMGRLTFALQESQAVYPLDAQGETLLPKTP